MSRVKRLVRRWLRRAFRRLMPVSSLWLIYVLQVIEAMRLGSGSWT